MGGDRREALDYNDFRIEFLPDPDGGGVRVRASCRDREGRESEATAEEPFPLDAAEIAELVPRVELAVYGRKVDGTRVSKMLGVEEPPDAPAERLSVASVGERLYEALLGGSIGRFYEKRRGDSGPLRIRIKLDLTRPDQRALSRLPWECLTEPGSRTGFLGTDFRSPIVRDVAHDEPVRASPVDGPLRVLVVTANPPGTAVLPGLEREADVIRRSFDELARNGQLVYDHIEEASRESINRHLRERADYHVLHFMGHGDYDESTGRGVLLLHGTDETGAAVADAVDSSDLALSIRGRCERMRLALLNACNTAVETRGAGAPLGGVATSMLAGGIPAVIAMQFQIEDRAAVTFARTLYRQLLAFRPIEEAVSDARLDVLTGENGADRTTDFWLTPVLYLRSGASGVLFERGRPVAEDPPDAVDPDADYVVWLTEWENRLVLNWRVNAEPGPTDIVALFDEEPTDPDAYLGINFERASDDGRPVRQTRVYLTDRPAEPGRYWAAYLRERERTLEIAATFGPFGESG